MGVGVGQETRCRLTGCGPYLRRLGSAGGMEGESAAPVARVGMPVPGHLMAVVDIIIAAGLREPFAHAPARGAAPNAFEEHEIVPLVEIRPESGQWRTCGRPLVLFGAQVVRGLGPSPATAASVILPICLDVVEVDPLDLFKLPFKERDLVFIALPLFLVDALEVFTFFTESEDLVLR